MNYLFIDFFFKKMKKYLQGYYGMQVIAKTNKYY